MEISCCGHCTTTVQEEKQVEEEEEEEVGKGRDSLQSLEESIRPLWGFRHNPATTNLTEIAKATFGVRIQESEKASNLTKTTKVVTPSAPIAATVVWATKKKFKSRCCSFWRTDRESDNFLFEQRHQRKPRQLVWLTGILSPIKQAKEYVRTICTRRTLFLYDQSKKSTKMAFNRTIIRSVNCM